MKVETTRYLDKNVFTEDDGYKIFLMDEILGNFLPLFNDEIDRQKHQLERNNQDRDKLKDLISDAAKDLKENHFRLKKNIAKADILKEINHLRTHELLFGKVRQFSGELLFGLNDMSLQELNESLKTLQQIVYKNVKKVLT